MLTGKSLTSALSGKLESLFGYLTRNLATYVITERSSGSSTSTSVYTQSRSDLEFLLVVSGNLGPITHRFRFRDMASFPFNFLPALFNPSLKMFPFNRWLKFCTLEINTRSQLLVWKVFPYDLPVSQGTSLQTNRQTTTMPIARTSLKYGRLRCHFFCSWRKTDDSGR